MDNYKGNKAYFIVLLLMMTLILLYLLIQNFGYIENQPALVPTGNVDIFEVDCTCCDTNDKDKEVFKEDDIDKNKLEENNDNPSDLVVYDNYKIWDNKELRIFSNPAYEYASIVAPGSFNSYTFVIRNNNSFDIIVDIAFEETNEKNINMNYKLRNNGKYLVGSNDTYEPIQNKKIEQIKIPAKRQKSYILDWKWIDSENDTQIGFDADATYKLSIFIGAN